MCKDSFHLYFAGWAKFCVTHFMIPWYKSKFTTFIMNPNLKAFVVYFKRENLPECFISTHLCVCVCVYVCVSQLVYMYIMYIKHFIFLHTSVLLLYR